MEGFHFIFTISSIFISIIFFVVATLAILNIIKHIKNGNSPTSNKFKVLDDALQNIINAQNKTNENDTEKQKVEYVCDYCGATLDENEKFCSACGSKKRTKKQSNN